MLYSEEADIKCGWWPFLDDTVWHMQVYSNKQSQTSIHMSRESRIADCVLSKHEAVTQALTVSVKHLNNTKQAGGVHHVASVFVVHLDMPRHALAINCDIKERETLNFPHLCWTFSSGTIIFPTLCFNDDQSFTQFPFWHSEKHNTTEKDVIYDIILDWELKECIENVTHVGLRGKCFLKTKYLQHQTHFSAWILVFRLWTRLVQMPKVDRFEA